MSALDNIPENKNFLSPFGFQFSIKKCQSVNFFVQTVNIPGINMSEYNSPNPFVKIPYGGDHISYSDLNVTFKVDEDLVNYLEIHNWIKQMGFPDDYAEYKTISSKPIWTGEGLTSDISLMILSSSRNPRFNIVFKDAFPMSLTGVEFNSTNPDLSYLTASTVFKYTSYDIQPYS